MAFSRELGNATSRQVHLAPPALIVPVGSIEQHGPHLPLDTDTRIANAVAHAVAMRLCAASGSAGDCGAESSAGDAPNWLVAPAVSYGASGEHEGFAGTVSIGTPALADLLVEFGRSACHWAHRVVFVNGHGGNVEALRRAVALLRVEGRDAGWCACVASNADAHAGHTETSVLLHISPDVVRQDQRAVGNRAPLSELMPQMRRGGIAAVSSLGVLGDPTTATADEGGRIFAEMVDACLVRVIRWAPDRDGMLK